MNWRNKISLKNHCRRLAAGGLLVGLIWGFPTNSFGQTWQVDDSRSTLGFTAIQAGAPFDGRFEEFQAEIIFDPAAPETAEVSIDIQITSVNTDYAERDSTLLTADWFDTAQWPQAHFKSLSFTPVGENRFDVKATLTMRGQTRDVILSVSIDFQTTDGMEFAHVKGELPIQRSDFGIGQGMWADTGVVGSEIVIKIDLWAMRAPTH